MPDLASLEACIEELIAFRDGPLPDGRYFTWQGQTLGLVAAAERVAVLSADTSND